MAGAANEYVFQRGFADGDALNLAGKRLNHFGYEAMSVLALDTNAVTDSCGRLAEPLTDALRQESSICRIAWLQQQHVAANLLAQICRRAQRDDSAFIQDR